MFLGCSMKDMFSKIEAVYFTFCFLIFLGEKGNLIPAYILLKMHQAPNRFCMQFSIEGIAIQVQVNFLKQIPHRRNSETC